MITCMHIPCGLCGGIDPVRWRLHMPNAATIAIARILHRRALAAPSQRGLLCSYVLFITAHGVPAVISPIPTGRS